MTIKLSNKEILHRLAPPKGKVRMILDTDTYNEVDDQFALSYALESNEKISLEAVYAAPFFNARVKNEQEGMEASYNEIKKIVSILKKDNTVNICKGAKKYLADEQSPVQSEATLDLIQRALNTPDGDLLYVVAIGAITNIASAILLEPKIIDKIVVVWLAGHPLHWPQVWEFNLMQDMVASKYMFKCGVPLTLIPCMSVASGLVTTNYELNKYLNGKSEIGTYLSNVVSDFSGDIEDFKSYNKIVGRYLDQIDDYDVDFFRNSFDNDKNAWSKIIWDISTIGYLVNPAWANSRCVSTPILNDDFTWTLTENNHPMRVVYYLHRDGIFGDMFYKLANVK